MDCAEEFLTQPMYLEKAIETARTAKHVALG